MPATQINKLRHAQLNLFRLMISAVLEKHFWNKRETAAELGISQPVLNWRIKQLGITPAKAEIAARQMKLAGDQLHKARPNGITTPVERMA